MNIVATDCHKRYSLANVQTRDGRRLCEERIEHRRGNIRDFLSAYAPGTPVAVETIGNWYWIVDEIEAAGMAPRLVHARKAKLMLGSINKTDKLDVRGLNKLQRIIGQLEKQMAKVFEPTPEINLLQSMPGVGKILSVVIALEVGDIRRFKWADRLASYAGTVPRVHASGGKIRYGRTRPDVNHYLKWAYAEAGNSVAVNRKRFPYRHASQLYTRVRTRRGHPQAVGAVGRHLAEATYWMLAKNEPYRERGFKQVQGAVSASLS